MDKHYKNERTLVIIKPDGVQRTLIGEIVSRYERMGLKLVGLKIEVPTEDLIEKHYTLEPSWKETAGKKAIESYTKKGETPPSKDPIEVGNKIIYTLKRYMTSGPVVAMVWQGAHAVEVIRKITGTTEPRSSDVGTIRGDFVLDSYQMADTDERAIRNLIHASGTIGEAENEIKLWFNNEDLIDYKLVQEQIIYSKDIGGII